MKLKHRACLTFDIIAAANVLHDVERGYALAGDDGQIGGSLVTPNPHHSVGITRRLLSANRRTGCGLRPVNPACKLGRERAEPWQMSATAAKPMHVVEARW